MKVVISSCSSSVSPREAREAEYQRLLAEFRAAASAGDQARAKAFLRAWQNFEVDGPSREPAGTALAASSGPTLKALADRHAQRARISERKAQRAALLASRPDLPFALRARLSKETLEVVQHYCATTPKGEPAIAPVTAALAASQAAPMAAGEAAAQVPAVEQGYLKRMGLGPDDAPRGIRMVNGHMVISARGALPQG